MTKRAVGILAAAGLMAVLAAGSVWWWRGAVENAALERTLVAAEKSAGEARFPEVRALLEDQARRRGRPAEVEAARRWLALEFRAAGGLRDFATLEALAAREPGLAAVDESAALWLWRARITEGDAEGAEAVRALWRGKEKQAVDWRCAELDGWAIARRMEDVRAALAALPAGEAEAVPLLLRKVIYLGEPAARFSAMEEAYRRDPADADMRALRAAVLEQAGQAAYARVDYTAALVADPENPLRRDELASYYLRQGDLMAAADTWREGLSAKSPDFQWVRAVFWGRMLGRPRPEAAAKLPEVRKARFAGWLATLPEKVFWDEAGYVELHLPGSHAEREPVVFWSRVLERLRRGEWTALETELAAAPSPAKAMAPTLLAALRLTAAVRAGAEPASTGIEWPGTGPDGHRWWTVSERALRGEAVAADEFAVVARGPLAATATLLAAGWPGAALALEGSEDTRTEATPGWVRYGLLEARRLAGGPEAALEWGAGLPAYPETDYAMAALRLAGGDAAAAEPVLRGLAERKDDTGFAAAWLLATWWLEQGRGAEAAALAEKAPALAGTPEAAGLRARAAQAAGNATQAAELLAPFAERSLEAGAFLARVAFEAGDLGRARALTEFWAERYPDNLGLRANLKAIAEKETRTAASRKAAP